MKKNNQGFTLIELLVTIAIIAIFSGVVLSVIHTSSRSFTTTSAGARVQMETQEIQDTIQNLVIDANRSVFYSNGSSENGIANDIDGYEDAPDNVDKTFYVCNSDTENEHRLFYDVLRWDALEHSLYSYYAEGMESEAKPETEEGSSSLMALTEEPDEGSDVGTGGIPSVTESNYETLLAENVISFRADTTKVLSQRIVRFRITVEEKGKSISTIHTVKLRNDIEVIAPPSDLKPIPKPEKTPVPETTVSPKPEMTLTPVPSPTVSPSPTPTPMVEVTLNGPTALPVGPGKNESKLIPDAWNLNPYTTCIVDGALNTELKNVTWECSGSEYASVSNNYLVISNTAALNAPEALGTVTMRAVYNDGIARVESNPVQIQLTRLKITAPSNNVTLVQGELAKCEVEAYGALENLGWSSSDENTLKINGTSPEVLETGSAIRIIATASVTVNGTEYVLEDYVAVNTYVPTYDKIYGADYLPVNVVDAKTYTLGGNPEEFAGQELAKMYWLQDEDPNGKKHYGAEFTWSVVRNGYTMSITATNGRITLKPKEVKIVYIKITEPDILETGSVYSCTADMNHTEIEKSEERKWTSSVSGALTGTQLNTNKITGNITLTVSTVVKISNERITDEAFTIMDSRVYTILTNNQKGWKSMIRIVGENNDNIIHIPADKKSSAATYIEAYVTNQGEGSDKTPASTDFVWTLEIPGLGKNAVYSNASEGFRFPSGDGLIGAHGDIVISNWTFDTDDLSLPGILTVSCVPNNGFMLKSQRAVMCVIVRDDCEIKFDFNIDSLNVSGNTGFAPSNLSSYFMINGKREEGKDGTYVWEARWEDNDQIIAGIEVPSSANGNLICADKEALRQEITSSLTGERRGYVLIRWTSPDGLKEIISEKHFITFKKVNW